MQRLSQHVQSVALLCRWHTPAPIGLLLWPTLWALWLSHKGPPTIALFCVFILGGVGMRTVGCVINDMADKDIDKYVKRTKKRPLAAEQLTMVGASAIAAVLFGLLAQLLYFLNTTTIILACIGVLLCIAYPFCKRYVACPQVFLGLTFSWGIPMAYGVSNQLHDVRGWLLYLSVAIWVIAYDTIYALQDIEDDKKIGIGSMAIWLDDKLNQSVGVAYSLFLAGLIITGGLYKLGIIYHVMLIISSYLLYSQWLALKDKPADYAKLFKLNQWIGCLVFIGIALSRIN